MRHISVFIIALTTALLLFAYAPIRNVVEHYHPKLENRYKGEYYSNFDSQNKVLLIGTGCWIILSSAYIDLNTGEVEGGGYAARADGLINVLSKKHYDLDKTFYMYGWKPSGDLETHTVSIFQALREKNVSALVYANAPGGLQAFIELEANLGVEPVLQEICVEYPKAAPYAANYLDTLRKSVGRQLAQTKKALQAPKDVFKEMSSVLEPVRSFNAIGAVLGRLASRNAPLQVSKSDLLIMDSAYPDISPEQYAILSAKNEADFDQVLEKSLQSYGKDGSTAYPYRPMMPVKAFWSCSAGIFDTWLRMVLTMAQQKNVAFVYYIPPQLQIDDTQRELFHTNYTLRVKTIMSEFNNAFLVDHSNLQGVSCCDLAPIRHIDSAPNKYRIIVWNPGYIFNFIGKIKTMRNLLASLNELGLVHARKNSPKVPLPVEMSLACPPALGRSYTFDFPEDSMQPSTQVLSTPLDNTTYWEYICKVIKSFFP